MSISTHRLGLMALFVTAAAATSGCGGGSASSATSAQTITFTSPGAQTLGVTPAALSASATSGLTVSFASTTPAVCTVAGTTLNLVSAGNCTISASQAGNSAYSAATPVSRTFAVSLPVSLTFASGYTNTDADNITYARAGRSVEGGSFNWYQDASANDWSNFWWNGISPVTDTPPSFYFGLGLPANTPVPYIGAYVQAPQDGSVTLAGQTNMRIAVWGNDQLTGRGVPTFKVFVQLKQSFAGCYVEVEAPLITPTGIGPQAYTLPLAGFAIKNNCANSGVSTAADALKQPLGAVHVQVLNANMQFTQGGDGQTPSRFPNGINLGPVSFEP